VTRAALPAVVKPTRVTNRIRTLRFGHGEMTQADGRYGGKLVVTV
jgi:hypothetical protein